MINLIPPEGHRIIRREYYLRVGATFAFLFGGVCLLLATAQIPRYVLVNAQINALAASEDAGEEREKRVRLENDVRLAQEIATQLNSSSNIILTSRIIEELLRSSGEDISFTRIQLEEKEKIDKVQAQGVAKSREALAKLKNDIESSSLFLSAYVPISDLARDRDLPFAITITVEQTR
jgi:hypothetical protein